MKHPPLRRPKIGFGRSVNAFAGGRKAAPCNRVSHVCSAIESFANPTRRGRIYPQRSVLAYNCYVGLQAYLETAWLRCITCVIIALCMHALSASSIAIVLHSPTTPNERRRLPVKDFWSSGAFSSPAALMTGGAAAAGRETGLSQRNKQCKTRFLAESVCAEPALYAEQQLEIVQFLACSSGQKGNMEKYRVASGTTEIATESQEAIYARSDLRPERFRLNSYGKSRLEPCPPQRRTHASGVVICSPGERAPD